ncbi:MAG: leucyl aminopeptidase family protein [Tumebacillaceae bacterium]
MNFITGSFQKGRTTILPVFIDQQVDQLGLQLKKYHGERKDHVVWFDHEGTRFVVVGLGAQSKFNMNKLRDAAAFGARAAVKEGVQEVTLLLPQGTSFSTEELVHAAVEGYILGEYRFDKYKNTREELTVEKVVVASLEGELSGMEDVIKTAKIYADGNNISRDLKNEPTNKMHPYNLASYVEDLFKDTPGATVEVIKGDDLVKHNFNGLLAVGKGSVNPPAMIKVTYQNDPSKPLTALVGKGLTFDSGGVSIKLSRDLSNMRMDMGGSAAVIGAMYILTRLQAPVNVVMLVATCENLMDANSMIPGDIIEYPNGVTVQVANTDAEGRLVLADALIHSQTLGAERVVDIATLTGACAMALGSKLAGLWGEESVVAGIKAAAKTTGENVWELPLWDEYETSLDSPYADVKNISEGGGGAITAALFLRRFVGENQKWAHIDIAGPMDIVKNYMYSNEGATGFGARLLADWARQ